MLHCLKLSFRLYNINNITDRKQRALCQPTSNFPNWKISEIAFSETKTQLVSSQEKREQGKNNSRFPYSHPMIVLYTLSQLELVDTSLEPAQNMQILGIYRLIRNLCPFPKTIVDGWLYSIPGTRWAKPQTKHRYYTTQNKWSRAFPATEQRQHGLSTAALSGSPRRSPPTWKSSGWCPGGVVKGSTLLSGLKSGVPRWRPIRSCIN